MTITWDEKLSVGNEVLDDDHRTLIRLINEYEGSIRGKDLKRLEKAFDGLEKYTLEHFEREEKTMEAVHFPKLREHREHHRKLMESVRDFHQSIDAHAKIDIGEISDFLRRWLVDHVIKEDMLYKPYLTGGRKA